MTNNERDSAEPDVLTRSERRKLRTRNALLDAAQRLVREHGYDNVTIQDITQAADVGLGTFYNYFDSKKAVLEAVLDDLNSAFFAELDQIQRGIEDPAQLFVMTLRHSLQCIIGDTPWAWFMVHSGLLSKEFIERSATRIFQEIERAANAGRFDVDDPLFALMMLRGLSTSISSSEAFGYPMSEDVVRKSLRYILRMLGVEDGEALRLASLPLPVGCDTSGRFRS